MSNSSFIEINLTKNVPWKPVELLHSLLQSGWRMNDHGKLVYLPMGDDDKFEWRSIPLEREPKVFEELAQKQRLNESIGVIVTYQDTQIGGNLLFLPEEKQISLSLEVNTRKAENGITDFAWYEEKLVPWLRTFHSSIDSVLFCESDSGGNIKYKKQLSGIFANEEGS